MKDRRGGRVVADITRSTVARDGDGNYAEFISFPFFLFFYIHFRRRYRHENEA